MPVNTRRIEARAPARIDLGGGWSDVPPFSDDEGGFVCNIAINRYAVATVQLADSQTAALNAEGESALASAALRRAQKNAGADQLSLHLHSDFPVGAGLGGSSAAGVASLGALLAWNGDSHDRAAIAELSRSVEVEDLGVPGGRQDHYAAAFGGALGLTFNKTGVDVKRIALSDSVREEIERRFVLLYTGQSRISGATISAVLDAYKSREPSVCAALRSMRSLAQHMAELMGNGSIDALALAIGEHWEYQRSLHRLISTDLIEAAMSAARQSGSMGAKAMGASGGGSVLFVARDGEEDKLRKSLLDFGQVIPFGVDQGGLTVRQIDSTA